jgi:hypothetical protein
MDPIELRAPSFSSTPSPNAVKAGQAVLAPELRLQRRMKVQVSRSGWAGQAGMTLKMENI